MSKKKSSAPENPGLLRFFTTKLFWLNIFGAMVATILLVWGVLFFVQQYSRHGESQTVPDLIGKTTSEAMDALDNLHLEYAVMDSTFDPDERPLTILNQDPLPDSKVKSGRTIYVTVNMAEAPKTEIPRFEVGTSLVSVREILESHGLKVGEIIYKPFEYRDVFLDMRIHGERKSLKPGTRIPKGTKIDLVLGNGLGDTKIIIPDLRGLTYIEAVNLIQLKELSIGTVIATGSIKDSADALVYRQFPMADMDRSVNLGSMIDIWITDDAGLINTSETPESEAK